MAYVSTSDIQGEFKSIDLTTSTALTLAKVGAFIAQEEATLNARLGKRYVTPITGANSILVVQGLATKLVKARCLDILQVKSGDAKTDQGVTGSSLRADVKLILDAIISKDMDLLDATLRDSADGVKSRNSSSACVERTFKRGVTQW